TSPFPWSRIASTAIRGTRRGSAATATRGSAPRRNLRRGRASGESRRADSLVLRERNGLRISRVCVAHDAEARVRRQDALDPLFGGGGPVAYDERARVRAVSNPDAPAVVHRHEIRAGGRVHELRVLPERLRDDLVRFQNVVRFPRDGDPAERAAALREHWSNVQGDEAEEREGVLDPCLLRLRADPVPVLEHDRPLLLELDHG